MSPRPVYILGTGLSHDGSACLLKDGRILVAVEKERLSRKKHDGGNDALAVRYCLEAAGLAFTDLALVVQAANFEKDIRPDRYGGPRLHHPDVPVVTVSHHLAHAYSAIATSAFTESNVLVIDGAGSPATQCDDWPDAATQQYWLQQARPFCEKDSFYRFDGAELRCLYKDFSELRLHEPPGNAVRMPTTWHSIGGLYAAASQYCFGNIDDAGKLMGLAPYGTDRYRDAPLFCLEDGRVQVLHDALAQLQEPAADYPAFKNGFQHYADVARWVQKETERAVQYVVRSRLSQYPHQNLCYAGGVALNAVANASLLRSGLVKNLYLQPAAGDNGLSVGCAYYGWHRVQGRELPRDAGTTVFFGKSYSPDGVRAVLEAHPGRDRLCWRKASDPAREVAQELAAGRVIARFEGGAEFGPRALGHRSILADPRLPDVQHRINATIKFREDFRPFAPAVLREEVDRYFQDGWDSPHMILVDRIRDEWRDVLRGVVHVDGTCRVQTVESEWNAGFDALVRAFRDLTGIGVLLNTSFNRKGMPIVETPEEALDFFLSCALDLLVIGDYLVSKVPLHDPIPAASVSV